MKSTKLRAGILRPKVTPMIPKLIEPRAEGKGGREILIRREEFLLGRGSDCDLRLSDINVSRHHCLIRTRPEEVTLADLGSSNGTYVNGNRIVSQVVLNSGDEIRVGAFQFLFELGEVSKLDTLKTSIDPLANTFRLGDAKKAADGNKHP
jgi:pSer/pThr/pTyr-binding forkhead associated (FHA) protein